MTHTTYFQKYTEAAPLAVFRILFGSMMLLSILRFWANGWIEKLYIVPTFFFTYYGFEFVRPFGVYTYLLFAVCGIAALFVALGYYYRYAIVLFFLSFTYIELMDKTTYLNHYYFISILSFLLIFLPAHRYFSLDAKKNQVVPVYYIPQWCLDSIKVLLGIVYFYAGLAKLNSDWLVRAMPLKIWLPSKYNIPLIGSVLEQEWVAYAFSYSGALYDLTIPFFLLWRKTRWAAFVLVVIFHALTRVLFPIGMFPYIMIACSLIFFESRVHHKILKVLSSIFRIQKVNWDVTIRKNAANMKPINFSKVPLAILIIFFCMQLTLPFRYMLYPGELFWTEEGYRFSWRVMLMEKSGYASFRIVNSEDQSTFVVNNREFLTSFQEKQMATQPDFILQFAHHLYRHYQNQGIKKPEIYVDSYVALNGRLSARFIDPSVNLALIKPSIQPKTWITPFTDEIKGL